VHRSFPAYLAIGLLFFAFAVFAPAARGQDQQELQCWGSSYIFSNETATSGSVHLNLHDNPTVHNYDRTAIVAAGATQTVTIYGYVFASSVGSSADATPNLTFVGFGDFGQVDAAFCAPPPVPSVGQQGLVALACLLAAAGALALRRR
jgi:hypothetical protein